MGDARQYAPFGMDEEGNVRIACENCGSANVVATGEDIDKCRDCGHWRYRVSEKSDIDAGTDECPQNPTPGDAALEGSENE